MTGWYAWLESTSLVRVCEYLLVPLAIAVACFVPSRYEEFFEVPESGFQRLARRPVLSLLAVAIAPVLFRLALLPLMGVPQPGVHDEYSYLLAADTFMHGRVANPPHSYPQFFESFHVLQNPTYASMYPPAQGLFLALGGLLSGYPWAGVLLSIALLCASLLWMLRGWLPATWALLGASLAVLRLGLFSYWANSYWGGAPAAIGGALVAGSLPRIFDGRQQRRQTASAIVLGFGLLLLGASRPYEGFFFSLPFVISLSVWLLQREGLRKRMIHVAVPLAGILLAGAAALAYYNWRITGHPLETPQLLNARQYAAGRLMLWSKDPPAPAYNDATMRDFYLRVTPGFMDVPHSLFEALRALARKVKVIYCFYLGPVLFAPLLLVPSVFWNARIRLLLLGMFSVYIGLACLAWRIVPHYFGPATCSLYALVILALMSLWKWEWRDRPCGRFLVRGVVAVAVLLVAVRISSALLGINADVFPWDWSTTWQGDSNRAALASKLSRSPERFLVIVRYGPLHDPLREWVYNEADLNSARIVWARDRGSATDALVQYFHDRRAVIVEPDVNPLAVLPYPSTAAPKAAHAE